MNIYLLTEDGDNHGAWNVLAWSTDRGQLEAEALRLEWERYRSRISNPGEGVSHRTLSPDECSYRRFGVKEVAAHVAAHVAESREPTDQEIIDWAVSEQFMLFCDEDEVTQIVRAALQHFADRKSK